MARTLNKVAVSAPRNVHLPSRNAALLFSFKSNLLKLRGDLLDNEERINRLPVTELKDYPSVMAEHRSPLWINAADSEVPFQLGKVQNLRRAARLFNGTRLKAGDVFRFWKQLGR